MKISPKQHYFLLWPVLCLLAGVSVYFWLSSRTRIYSASGSTMGTYYQLTWIASRSFLRDKSVISEVEKRLRRVNSLMSTYLEQSEISRFNQFHSRDWFQISPETASVIQEALSISRLSGGAFDISVGTLVDLWGFGPENRVRKVPEKSQLQKMIPVIGYEKLTLKDDLTALKKAHPKMHIDLSGIAKGYGVDVLADYFVSIGVENFLVDIGGELKARGTKKGKKWQIGIELPRSESFKVQKLIPLYNMAMATSGDYRNYFEDQGKRYSHTIDPRSGNPIDHRLASVTVLNPSCMRADGVATALMVLGSDEGYELAIKNNWAVQFLTRADDSFKERTTPKFKELIKE